MVAFSHQSIYSATSLDSGMPMTKYPQESSEEDVEHKLQALVYDSLPSTTAVFSYATEGALFISAQLSSDAVSALRKFRVLV